MVKKGSKWASGIIDVLGMTTVSGIDGMYLWMDGMECIDSLSVWV